MPDYTYQCENKHRADIEHSIYEDPEIICGECQGRMGRVPAGIAPRFVGKGFYSTDKKDNA